MREDGDVAVSSGRRAAMLFLTPSGFKTFLGKAIDPPKTQAVENALATLDELGATDIEGKLTALGRQMVSCQLIMTSARLIHR